MRVSNHPARVALLLAALVASACGGGGGGTPPPPAPASVDARPGNGQALVAWSAAAGASGYVVYYGDSPKVTKAAARIAAAGTSTPVTGLANGTPYWFAVAAVNAGGEGGLSPAGCAVPTPADQSGLTLRDALCGEALDGSTWWPDGLRSAEVVGGAAVLHAEMDGMEPFGENGSVYGTSQTVYAAGQRVTTLRAGITVPRTAAATTGAQAQVRASIRLSYSQPEDRLLFPHAVQDMLAMEVGLVDQGSGLRAYRIAYHCDDAACTTSPSTGIAFADPAGWTDEAGLRVAPASYDTTYTFEVRLAEGEGTDGVFHWSASGGAFGAGVSGSADPAGYLAGPAWSGVPIAGAGATAFEAAQIRAVTLDRSPAGGGSGRISARFDDVAVGFDDVAATPFDDFSGAGGNSGPVELSMARWVMGGTSAAELSGGSLTFRLQVTSAGGHSFTSQSLFLAHPDSVRTFQADLRVASTASDLGAGMVQWSFYNDGSPGGAPGSAVGDVLASVFLDAVQDRAVAQVGRCFTPTCSPLLEGVGGSTFPAPLGTGWHTVRLAWDPVMQQLTLAVDGDSLTFYPTMRVPAAGPANAPMLGVMVATGAPATTQAASSIEVRMNNVFTAP